MTGRVTCPSCHAQLRVPDTLADTTVTCPRCLAPLANPLVAVSTAPRPASPAPPPASCPWCGRPVESRWQFCPHCQEDLRAPAIVVGPRFSVERQIRRDRRRTNVGLIILAALGATQLIAGILGGLLSAASATTTRDLQGGLTPLAFTGGVVLVLALIVTGIMWFRTQGRPEERSIGRVVVGTLALYGGLGVATCAVVFALVIFAFAVCAFGKGPNF